MITKHQTSKLQNVNFKNSTFCSLFDDQVECKQTDPVYPLISYHHGLSKVKHNHF